MSLTAEHRRYLEAGRLDCSSFESREDPRCGLGIAFSSPTPDRLWSPKDRREFPLGNPRDFHVIPGPANERLVLTRSVFEAIGASQITHSPALGILEEGTLTRLMKRLRGEHFTRICLWNWIEPHWVRALQLEGYSVEYRSPEGKLYRGRELSFRKDDPLESIHGSIPETKAKSSKRPVFPLEVFPESIQRFIRKAEACGYPADFLAVGCLVVAGVCAGTHRSILMSPGWVEYPTLYSAVVGHPGVLKTPSLNLVTKPLSLIDLRLEAEYATKKVDYDLLLTRYREHDLKEYRYHGGTVPIAPTPPPRPTVMVDNITLESLAEELADSPRGLLIYPDELTAWLKGMNQYRGGKGTDRQFFLKAWSCATYKVNRKSERYRLNIERPFTSVLGGIQPDLLTDLSGERDDGFFSRLLMSFPDTPPSSPFEYGRGIGPKTLTSWIEICERLWDASSVEKVYSLNPAGGAEFQRWYRKHSEEVLKPDFPQPLEAFWAKMKAHCGRFALILRLIHQACDPTDSLEEVGPEDVERAVLVADYFNAHTKLVYERLGWDKIDENLVGFLRWLDEHGGKVSLSELVKRKLWNVKGRESGLKLLNQAQDRGLGQLQPFEGDWVFERSKKHE